MGYEVMIKKILYISIVSGVLVACATIPKEAYFNRGEPESLLDFSSEVVNVKIESPASVQDIISLVNQEQPTRAELNCADGDPLCKEVQTVVHQFGIPVKYTSSTANNASFIYERVLARDCENRYIDRLNNPYNLNYPTFGCSTAVNMVQMVSDKRQFTSPAIMGPTDATKPLQAMTNYKTPVVPDTNFSSEVSNSSGVSGTTVGTSGGGGSR